MINPVGRNIDLALMSIISCIIFYIWSTDGGQLASYIEEHMRYHNQGQHWRMPNAGTG